MINSFFFGGVAPGGFSTQLTQIINGKEYYTYILKGGPGTGKSRMMKKIADRFAKDEDVTCFYCSADPDSLDAVMMHTSKVLVVDGTPPHVSEPRLHTHQDLRPQPNLRRGLRAPADGGAAVA